MPVAWLDYKEGAVNEGLSQMHMVKQHDLGCGA